jgi:hypothetical protein
MSTSPERWYVGSMNDCLFIIDQPPRPSNDDVNPDHDVNVIAKVADLGPEGDRHARLIAASPDLLEACQAFVAWDEDAHSTEADAATLRRVIAAAVTKATGQPATPPAHTKAELDAANRHSPFAKQST